MKRADKLLIAGGKTYRKRNKVYGDNYLRVGGALAAMFPDGVTLKTEKDHNRFQILNLIFVKLSRYIVNWTSDGHADSIHDAMVYSAMLEAIDAMGPEQLAHDKRRPRISGLRRRRRAKLVRGRRS